MSIEAKYKGKSKYYKGKISRVRLNGTYDVVYADGDKELGVPEDNIRKAPMSSPRTPSGNSRRRLDNDYGLD